MAAPSQDDKPFELKDLPLSQKLIELLLQVLTPSSGVISGLGAFILLPMDSPLLKAIAAIALGSGVTLTGKVLKPLSQASQEKAENLGKRATQLAGRLTEQAITEITNVDERYAACQAAACETITTEGLLTGKLGGLFTPMLDQVYVPLELDRSAQSPSLCHVQEIFEREDEDGYASLTVDIWKLLALADRDRIYRQLAVLAWGGYGKTTLLRHLAFTLGKRQQPEDVKPLLPVLLLLRKYREILTRENPLSLPDLITHQHFSSLPATKDVNLPSNWADRRLKTGQIVVLIDGFDEVPKSQRGQVAQWINRQIEKYGRSLFIVTSRPKAYTEQSGEHQLNFSTVLWVKDFQEKQRKDFIDRWYWCQEFYTHGKEDVPIVRQMAQTEAADLLKQIQQRPELSDLSRNPLLLNMLAMFHRCNPKVDIPKRRTDVFQGICQLWLKDRPEARGLDLGVEDWENAQIVLQQLALAMMEFPEPRIGCSELLRRLSTSLQELDETVEVGEFLEKVERISEMLIQREAGEYEFPHNSFQEFLAAKEVLRLGQESIICDHFGEDKWKPMTLLYAGLTKKPSRLIREALKQRIGDLAYELGQETRRRIDDDLKQELDELKNLESINQAVEDARFKKLKTLLNLGKWRDADYETYRLMITTVGKGEGQWFERADYETFPCNVLHTIDQLWVHYSDGKWGFSVQRQIWEECGSPMEYNSNWEKFGDCVGWRKHEDWLHYKNLSFDIKNTVSGEFPFFRMEWRLSLILRSDVSSASLFSRARTCRL